VEPRQASDHRRRRRPGERQQEEEKAAGEERRQRRRRETTMAEPHPGEEASSSRPIWDRNSEKVSPTTGTEEGSEGKAHVAEIVAWSS